MDPDKVQGDIQRPYQPEPEQSDKIDPEKFKKVMKVDDTDEAQKRNKRNLKREEEEGEDDEVQEEAPPPTSSAFSEFMSDKDQLDNVMDAESGGVRYQAAPEDESFVAPEPGSINTEGVESEESEPSPQPPPSQAQQPSAQEPQQQPPPSPAESPPPQEAPPPPTEESFSPPLYEGEFEEQPFNPNQPEQAQPQDDQTEPTSPQEPEQKEKGQEQPPEKKKEEDTSLLASQPKLSDIMPKKKKTAKKPGPEIRTLPKDLQTPKDQQKTPEGKELEQTGTTKETSLPEQATEKTSTPLEQVPGDQKTEDTGLTTGKVSEAMQPGMTSPPQKGVEKEETPFRRLSSQEVRNQRIGKEKEATTASLEGMVVPSSGEGQKGEMGKEQKEKDDQTFLEATPETASIILPTFDAPIAPLVPAEETPAYTRLTPDVHELFEKMGGVMLVQMDKGVTTTTMDIQMPNSVFNGAQVILEQYDTAPHSYNLQLIGSPEAVKVFTSNMKDLETSFKQANFNFEVNILNPSISKETKPPHLIRRKGSSGGKGDSGGKQKGG